jgi:hypothetical protein
MQGITIADFDERGVLTVGLYDILVSLGPRAASSSWLLSNVEALGAGADALLEQMADVQDPVPGDVLLGIAERVNQVIDGKFVAFDAQGGDPWITVYAVDSSAFDVVTDDLAVLNGVRSQFPTATDIPDAKHRPTVPSRP